MLEENTHETWWGLHLRREWLIVERLEDPNYPHTFFFPEELKLPLKWEKEMVESTVDQVCSRCGNLKEDHNPQTGHEFTPMHQEDFQPHIKMNGWEADMTPEEFKRIFNKGLGNIAEKTPEEVQDHIAKLENAIRIASIYKYAGHVKLNSLLADKTEEYKKKLKERSKKFKVNATPKETRTRAASITKLDKFVAALVANGFTRDAAIELAQKNGMC